MRTTQRAPLPLLIAIGAACSADPEAPSAGSGGVPAASGGTSATGGVSASGGETATGGAGTGGASAAGGTAGSGAAGTGGGPAAGGAGGDAGSSSGGLGGASGAPGGGAGGMDATAGAGGGAAGSGPMDSVDSDGCPITLEGFATVDAMGQDGTYGGRDGQTVTVKNQAELEQYAGASEPYVIRVQGTIQITPKGKEIRVASHKTLLGVGATAAIAEGGFNLGAGTHNVILRNLTIRDSFVEGDWAGDTQDFDGIQLDSAHHIWIDHCHLHHMGDGLIDSRKDTTFVTTSWNILSDHNKAYGIGWTENVTAQMTIHHNWLRDLNQRNPAVDNVLRAHLFNNFMQRIDAYGNHARGGTNMVLENSVFDDVNRPHFYDTGTLVARGNLYRSSRGDRTSTGSSYSFFDPSEHYAYTLHPTEEVEALLAKCAGPRPTLGL